MTLLFFTVILAIVAAISSLLDIEKKSKNFKIKNTFIYIFLLGTIIASILQYRESESDKVIAGKKDSAFIKSQSDIIQLQIKNKKESDSLDNIIIALNNQLDGKTEELMKSSMETLAQSQKLGTKQKVLII
ncbi:hypothetical protein [Chryseobacterium schmidteae]|uniref:hypothetical protein n=1 Tax=Chryseobacterium schmidteae TaxID=2730404 RepID=UPI00158CC5B3|nr:hypothetical protein [Chryseobacterium schmidteae]